MIPQTDPSAGYRALKAQIDDAVLGVLSSGHYILGSQVAAFETEFAAWLGAQHAASCASGTDAIALALRALDIGPDSTVVTVSHTAVATVAAIELVGATPLLIDIEPNFYTMDPVELADVLDHPPAGMPPIRAVIPVHLYGQPVDLDPILKVCSAHGVAVIEDCAQAHGATYAGKPVGGFAEASAFSFYPTKNLGAFGDGGLVALRDADLCERVRALRQYGWRTRFLSAEQGMNSRLDEMQAAILRVRLRQLDAMNARRGDIAKLYDAALSSGPVASPARRPDCQHVYHQYVLQVSDRDLFRERMHALGVGTAVHYPAPVHEQEGYVGRVRLGPSGCRASSKAAKSVVSLPMFPELSNAQAQQVCAAMQDVLKGGAHAFDQSRVF